MNPNPVPARSSLLFLCVVRLIVEKHGGHLVVNENNNTFTVNIPEERKMDCFAELEAAVGPLTQVQEHLHPIQ